MNEQPRVVCNQPWINQSDWPALQRDVDKLERVQKTQFYKHDMVAEYLAKVRDHISGAAMIGRSSLLAVGYGQDGDYIDPRPENAYLIDSDNVIIRDVNLREIDDEDRVVLDCEVVDPTDESVAMPFAVLPLGIVWAESHGQSTSPMMKYIANAKIHAQRLLGQGDFFTLPVDQQQELLSTRVVRELIADYAAEYDDDVTVSTGCQVSFLRNFDDMNTPNWTDCQVGAGVVNGVIIDAIYLETLTEAPQQLTSKQDFMFDGLPCLVVSDRENATMSYVPINQITDFHGSSDES